MMNPPVRASFLLLMVLCVTGCASTLMLRNHHQALKQLAKGNLPPKDTFEGLAGVMVGVFRDALSLPKVDQRVNFLRKFSKQNDQEIRLIFQRLNAWQDGMKPREKIQFATSTLQSPNTAELVRMMPEVLQLLREDDTSLGNMRKLLLLYRVRQWLRQ